MTTNSTWAALRNPAFRKLWIAAVISGTCVAAHDSAATWTMNIFTGSPLLLSLMSTVASLPFFLFTLPAGFGFAINAPAWTSIMPQIVSDAELPSAATLSGLQFNISGIIGPALGGLLVP